MLLSPYDRIFNQKHLFFRDDYEEGWVLLRREADFIIIAAKQIKAGATSCQSIR